MHLGVSEFPKLPEDLLKCALAAAGPSHLVGGHVADGAVRLDGFQLIQTPVQLLHGLHRQLLVGLVWIKTHRNRGTMKILLHGHSSTARQTFLHPGLAQAHAHTRSQTDRESESGFWWTLVVSLLGSVFPLIRLVLVARWYCLFGCVPLPLTPTLSPCVCLSRSWLWAGCRGVIQSFGSVHPRFPVFSVRLSETPFDITLVHPLPFFLSVVAVMNTSSLPQLTALQKCVFAVTTHKTQKALYAFHILMVAYLRA